MIVIFIMNHMNNTEEVGIKEPRMPEFAMVLELFRKSNSLSFELTDRITYLVGRLKPIQAYETKSSNTEKVIEQDGVISEFYELNSQTNKVNNQLQIITQHLESLLD